MAPAVAALAEDRVRTRRWSATGTNLDVVIEQLRRQEIELSEQDMRSEQGDRATPSQLAGEGGGGGDDRGTDHPHPRNCVLNLVITLGDHHRLSACDDLIGMIAASHPLRCVLLHPGGGSGAGSLDAEITTEAHKLLGAFPVQRSQVLLHVRGEAVEHLASLVGPLLAADVPTYLWWSGKEQLDSRALHDVLMFADVLVVDSARFPRPARGLLDLALAREAEGGGTLAARDVGIQDLGWERLKPWRDAIAQAFAPAERRPLLADLHGVEVATGGMGGRSGLVGGAVLAGWVAAALGWRLVATPAVGVASVEAVAEGTGARQAKVVLRSDERPGLEPGELSAVRLAGTTGGNALMLAVERQAGAAGQASVTIDLGGSGAPVRQHLTMPAMGEPELMLQVLWASRHDPFLERSLTAAIPLLQALV